MKGLSGTEANTLSNFIYQLTMTKDSGDNAINKMMKTPVMPYTSILDELPSLTENLKINVSFVYGDRDWLDTQMAMVKISSTLIALGYKVTFVPDSDHHLYIDNSDGLLDTLDQEFHTSL